jgi:hypothetical protein
LYKSGGERSNEEIQKALDNYEKAYADLEAKHEEVTMLIEDDKQFEEEEQWIEQCHTRLYEETDNNR